MWTWRPCTLEAERRAQRASASIACSGGSAELRAVVARLDRVVRVGVDARRDAHEHAPHAGGAARSTSSGASSTTSQASGLGRRRAAPRPTCCCRATTICVGGRCPARSANASSPSVDTSAPSPSSASRRRTATFGNAFDAVEDRRVRRRLAVRARPRPQRLLAVDDERRAELSRRAADAGRRRRAARRRRSRPCRGRARQHRMTSTLAGVTLQSGCRAFSHRAGSERGAAAAASHGLSNERLFCLRGRGRTMERYDPQQIEAKWQRVWEDERAFHDAEPGARARRPASTTGTSSRCCRTRRGRCTWGTSSTTRWATSSRTSAAATAGTVLRPMGFDSFGLPAENAAIREGGHPREITERNIASIREQMKRLGWAIDWDREVSAHEAGFYRWTQWLFLQLLRARPRLPEGGAGQLVPERPDRASRTSTSSTAAASAAAPRSRRGTSSSGSSRSPPTPTSCSSTTCRRAATGPSGRRRSSATGSAAPRAPRSSSAIDELDVDVPVFTTRPDTLFGATFFVLAPEHPLVERIDDATRCARTRKQHRRASAARSARPRRRRPASSPGCYATNPVNGERMPIWVADYVLMEYGTGAIMAVPAHDERDREFAETFDLPIVAVVDRGRARWSTPGEFDGTACATRAKTRDRRVAGEQGQGEAGRLATACATGASRGSATGAARSRSSTATTAASSPCPTTSCRCCCPRSRTTGRRACRRSPRNEEWLHVPCPTLREAGRRARRTRWTPSSTRPGTSCATSTRTTRTRRSTGAIVDYWCPIDQYIGGIDHATGHLLYSRFFVKVMNELGLVGFREPFATALPPGLGADGRHEDVEVEGQRRRARRARRRVRRRRRAPLHPLPRARRPGHGVDGHGHRGHRRASSAGSGGSCTRWLRARDGAAGRRHAARPQGARDDREGHRRHRAGGCRSTRRSRR